MESPRDNRTGRTSVPKDGETLTRLPAAELAGLQDIVSESPAVVVVWRMADGFPVEFMTDNISQFGYTAEDFTSGRMSWVGITHPEDVPRLEREVETYLKDGVHRFSQQYRLRAASGEYRWMQDWNRCILDEGGRVVRIRGMFIDVTARREAEEALRESEESFRALAENAGEGIIISAADGKHAQEATTNALRHGKARQVVVRLSIGRKRGRLVISDNGAGLAGPAEQQPGLGLRIMRYRAEMIGGRLTIASERGRGTNVTCEFPWGQPA